jgi:hypothetical protein
VADGARRWVTRWIESLKASDGDTAQRLWQRSFEALVRPARHRLRGVPKGVADEENAALSAFDSSYRGASHTRDPWFDDRDDVWRLLVVKLRQRPAAGRPIQDGRRHQRGGRRTTGVQPSERRAEDRAVPQDLGVRGGLGP